MRTGPRWLLVAVLVMGFGLAVPAAAQTAEDDASKRTSTSLTTGKAVVLGFVEGVTEYLPISSTGHLLVVERILDVGQTPAEAEAMDTYTVVIQIGAILAVLGIYRSRFATMLQGVAGRNREGRGLAVNLLLAFVPAVVIALLLQDPIKEQLLKPWPVVAAWAVGGAAVLLFSSRGDQLSERFETLDAIPPRIVLGIGCAQVASLWPGSSRSLVTILAALLLGCTLRVAVEFSFLLGFLTLSAATGYEMLNNGDVLVDTFGLFNPLVGVVVAAVSAWASVRWMVAYLERRPLTIFGWYRLGAAALTAGLLVTGAI